MNLDTTESIPVMEQFYTIQGEGAHTGTPAYFIRLGGCDVGCVWCDVKESWDIHAHPKKSISQLVEDVKDAGADRVVITGGEPCMHDLTHLTKALRDSKIKTHLETAGVHPITGEWDWICFSPKKFKKPLPQAYELAHELKVVVFHGSDIKWAQGHAELINDQAQLFLQPEWDRREEHLPSILNFVREHPQWRLSLQTHKYIGIP
ncbi:MAG: 7-carboxy-7-deazaguanine synthase QueE [Flavobacteriales bacterium]|nr:7-carboxy-7-deazaguanine synthase QueE [Flavobacteriales bacterium]